MCNYISVSIYIYICIYLTISVTIYIYRYLYPYRYLYICIYVSTSPSRCRPSSPFQPWEWCRPSPQAPWAHPAGMLVRNQGETCCWLGGLSEQCLTLWLWVSHRVRGFPEPISRARVGIVMEQLQMGRWERLCWNRSFFCAVWILKLLHHPHENGPNGSIFKVASSSKLG